MRNGATVWVLAYTNDFALIDLNRGGKVGCLRWISIHYIGGDLNYLPEKRLDLSIPWIDSWWLGCPKMSMGCYPHLVFHRRNLTIALNNCVQSELKDEHKGALQKRVDRMSLKLSGGLIESGEQITVEDLGPDYKPSDKYVYGCVRVGNSSWLRHKDWDPIFNKEHKEATKENCRVWIVQTMHQVHGMGVHASLFYLHVGCYPGDGLYNQLKPIQKLLELTAMALIDIPAEDILKLRLIRASAKAKETEVRWDKYPIAGFAEKSLVELVENWDVSLLHLETPEAKKLAEENQILTDDDKKEAQFEKIHGTEY